MQRFFKQKKSLLDSVDKDEKEKYSDEVKKLVDNYIEENKESLKQRALELGVAPENVEEVLEKTIKASENEAVKKLFQFIEENMKADLSSKTNSN